MKAEAPCIAFGFLLVIGSFPSEHHASLSVTMNTRLYYMIQ
jgi:hypothetical protein